MPDNDSSFTYQKKMPGSRQTKVSVQTLITLERAQKLDLLVHLISNLSQSLVICGSQGIGKTRLVETLIANNSDSWPICIVQGGAGLSFEAVLEQFTQQLMRQEEKFAERDLTSILQQYQKNNSHVVLIVDDAGMLVPGLITALIQYAHANNAIRLVLTLTHDELHIKHSSDSIIDECHFIEIPPLSKKQCMTFLQNVSAQPDAPISFNAVTDGLVDNLYSVTHGIPGRILAELPRLSEYQSKTGIKWGAVAVGLILLVMVGVGIYLNQPSLQRDAELTKSRFDDDAAAVIQTVPVMPSENSAIEASQLPTEEAIQESHTQTSYEDEEAESLFKAEELDRIDIEPPMIGENDMNDHQGVVAGESKAAVQTPKPQQIAATAEEAQPELEQNADLGEEVKALKEETKHAEAKQIAKKTAEEAPGAIEPTIEKKQPANDARWVIEQEANHYTLQLMVLSSKRSVTNLLKKYPDYKQAIKFFNIGKPGQEKYVLIYGAFTSSAEAAKAKKNLPSVFQNAWVRKFKVLQKQVEGN